MEILYVIYIVATLLLSLVFMALSHTTSKSNILTTAYIHQISEHLNHQSSQSLLCHNQAERQALLDALYYIMAHSYGVDLRVICKIIYDNKLDHYICHKIIYSTDSIHRAKLLLLQSYLPHNYDCNKFQHLLDSRNADLRRGAILSTLASNPSMAIHTITKLRYELSSIDLALIISLLRRNMIPIACEPLLKSSNLNLVLLGMAIVRHFGITIADKELYTIIAQSSDHRILHEAIYTLSSIHATLHGDKVQPRLNEIDPMTRRSICRHLSVEGYSIEAIRQAVPTKDHELAARIILSHKRQLYASATVQ